jgi:hypothetical protein
MATTIPTSAAVQAVNAVEQLPCESLREAFCRCLGRRMGLGDAIAAVWELEKAAREHASYASFRSNSTAACTQGLLLSDQTELACSVTVYKRPGRLISQRTTWKLNGRRCSRDSAMAAARLSVEGSYHFEDGRYGWAASGTHPASPAYQRAAGQLLAHGWVNIARCANQRKDKRFGPSAVLGLPASSQAWLDEHQTERMAIRQACRVSRIGAGLAPAY